MVRPASYRASKYAAKIDPDAIRLRIVAHKDSMVEQVTAIQQSIVDVENDVKSVLETQTTAVAPALYPPYLAFGKELWKIANKFSGTAKALEGKVAYEKWVTRGLTSTILKAIGSKLGYDTSGWGTP